MPLIEVCFILLMMLSQKSLPKGLRGRNLAWDVGKYIYIITYVGSTFLFNLVIFL